MPHCILPQGGPAQIPRPTRRDFHGWDGDEWYDQEVTQEIPKEVKLGLYVTDVRSGAFNYIKGTHRKEPPRRIRTADLPAVPASQVAEFPGAAAFSSTPRGLHPEGAATPDITTVASARSSRPPP
jgi:hypothetical protein